MDYRGERCEDHHRRFVATPKPSYSFPLDAGLGLDSVESMEANTTSNLKLSLAVGSLVNTPYVTYQNINYAMMRIIIPYIVSPQALKNVEPNPGLFDITSAVKYVQFVKSHLLEPLEISADTTPTPPANHKEFTEYYGKSEAIHGVEDFDSTLVSGAMGWHMSAFQVAKMMGQLSVLTGPFPGIFDAMKSYGNEFGLGTLAKADGKNGKPYQGHNGRFVTDIYEMSSCWMTYHSGYAAAYVVNSPILQKFPLPPPFSSSGRLLLRDAFDIAFP
ncbi:MAG: hypothetical protein U0359_25385 [Byssovorax sp.]